MLCFDSVNFWNVHGYFLAQIEVHEIIYVLEVQLDYSPFPLHNTFDEGIFAGEKMVELVEGGCFPMKTNRLENELDLLGIIHLSWISFWIHEGFILSGKI